MANYYCEFCGSQYGSVAWLLSGTCPRNPDGSRRHSLYQGSEKSQYTCKYCGSTYGSIAGMTSGNCPYNANHQHVPAL